MQILNQLTSVTFILIIINVLIFAIGIVLDRHQQIIINFGFVPDQLFKPLSPEDNLQTTIFDNIYPYDILKLFSSMFIHAGIAHLAFNLFALGYIGWYSEKSIGSVRYIVIYVISGVTGALLHGIIASFILGNGHIVLVGASGAISGVLGIAAATGNIRAYYWLVIQIVFAFIGSVASIPIAFSAHIGGFIAGMVLAKLIIKIERRKREHYRRGQEDTYDGMWQ